MQFSDVAASAGVWFRLMAAPVPSTGSVARSPIWLKAIGPLAKAAAGGTTALAVALALAVVVGSAGRLCAGAAEALAAGAAPPDGSTFPAGAALPDAEDKHRAPIG